jgi:fused signal recognition particle receptor
MFRKITLFCVFLAFCVVVLGAYVRLSDAGLGCPDWPGCYGEMVVPDDVESIDRANEAFPERPLEAEKAWKEMVHRYLAGTLGLAIFLLWLMSWWVKQAKWSTVAFASGLLLLVVFQAALGMWTVTLKVMPLIVMAHLLAGLATLALLFRLYLQSNSLLVQGPRHTGLKWFAGIGLLLLVCQIALGGWTSTNYAALACPDFPTCLGQWWPDVDYRQAFTFQGGFGIDYEGGILEPRARAAIHWVHRLGAVVVLIVLGSLALLAAVRRYPTRLRVAGLLLGFVLTAQIVLGIGNVLLRMPVAVAVAHNAVAALLLLVVVYLHFYAGRSLAGRRREKAAEAAEPLGPAVRKPSIETMPPIPVEMPPATTPENLFFRLKSQLNRTRSGLTGVLAALPVGKKAIDDDVLEEIEAGLLMADIGVDATAEIIDQITERVQRHQLNDSEALTNALHDNMLAILEPCSQPLEIPEDIRPFVILVVGVNGVGKTTTIGKLAKRLQWQGHSVMLAAGDTFRAAAIEQLQTWGERNQIPVIAQHTGADSASVIYDAVQAAKARGIDVLIADTAGRLHTKSHLMEELRKIKRIIGKIDPSAPHEVLLVLDAGTGQNAISQAKQFNEAVELTGIALTKLDGTAKGGVIVALAKQLGIPVRFIGIGEGIDDLQDFDAKSFVDALFVRETLH